MRTHNSSETIVKTLNSLLHQTYPYISLVVYDDKSTDRTLQLLEKYKPLFERRGFSLTVISSKQENNEGCGKSSERLNRIIASQINDNDIFMGLDSDDVLLNPTSVQDCVEQMNKSRANILIVGYDIQGDESLVINDKGGVPHNELSHKLASHTEAVSITDMPEIASTADSIGWTKIVDGIIFKRYVGMYPETPKEMNVCEDFPTLAMFLYKDARISGLKDNVYGYYKHAQSTTAQIIQKEAFSVVRLGFLKVLQDMYKNNPEMFVEGAEQHINRFIEKKYAVIGNIVDKKSKEGLLVGYDRRDFERDFKTKIDCENLNLSRYLDYPSSTTKSKGKPR